jgi:hypothetical protein
MNMKFSPYKWKRHGLRTAFLSICLCLFASTALAKEIVMTCTLYQDGETLTRYLKYSNPLIGRKQIYQRIDGSWQEWCRPSRGYHCELTITNRGAIMKTVSEYTANPNNNEYGLHAGDDFLYHEKYILDFEFSTRRMEWYEAHMDGRPFSSGPSLENPEIQIWNCKLN